jgi:hypothetical protein
MHTVGDLECSRVHLHMHTAGRPDDTGTCPKKQLLGN